MEFTGPPGSWSWANSLWAVGEVDVLLSWLCGPHVLAVGGQVVDHFAES